jgi:hypothetical protein
VDLMAVPGRIKAAKLDTSARLQRALILLIEERHRWLTTRTIIRRAGVCAVNAVIAELRENGAVIECKTTVVQGGGRRWSYRLTKAPEGWE